MPSLRVALVIFALWILVVEPTFGAYERMEQYAAPTQHDQSHDDGCANLDQQVPPGEVVSAPWANQHLRADFLLPVLTVELVLPRPEARLILPLSLPIHLSLPYPPSVAPLRL
jgi:hypothetical protein